MTQPHFIQSEVSLNCYLNQAFLFLIEPLSSDVIIFRSQNQSSVPTHLSSCDNMSGDSGHHVDSIEIDYDRSQGLPTSINVRSVQSEPQARGAAGHGRTT